MAIADINIADFMEIVSASPTKAEWQHGPLPCVDDVAYDCRIALWSPRYIGIVLPHGDPLNPVRWSDSSMFPLWGIEPPIGWWAWLDRGSRTRPAGVKTWKERYGDSAGGGEERRRRC